MQVFVSQQYKGDMIQNYSNLDGKRFIFFRKTHLIFCVDFSLLLQLVCYYHELVLNKEKLCAYMFHVHVKEKIIPMWLQIPQSGLPAVQSVAAETAAEPVEAAQTNSWRRQPKPRHPVTYMVQIFCSNSSIGDRIEQIVMSA